MSEEDTLEEALTQEHHRWPGGTRRVCVGGVASGSRGQEKCQSRGLGWTQAASPGGHP